MTLIISAGCSGRYVLQVSDRLTTTERLPGLIKPYDIRANKMVIYRPEDAICAIGYCGQAYVGSQPTDEWLAQQLWGQPFHRSDVRDAPVGVSFGRSINRWGLNRAIWWLRQSIVRFNVQIEVNVAGWRQRGSRVVPFIVCFGAPPFFFTRSDLVMRPWPRSSILRLVASGDHPDALQLRAAVTKDQWRAGEGAVTDALIALVRRRAEATPRVGRTLMTVQMPHPEERKIHIQFRPDHQSALDRVGVSIEKSSPAAYTPWIVTVEGFQSPQLTVGLGTVLDAAGFGISCESPDVPKPPKGLLPASIGQVRMKPPKAR